MVGQGFYRITKRCQTLARAEHDPGSRADSPGGVPLRLLNHQRIAPGAERESNFLELLSVATLLGDEGRDLRYAEIVGTCRSRSESLRTRLCARFDRGGSHAGAARRVVHRLPRRLRHWLADQELRFAMH